MQRRRRVQATRCIVFGDDREAAFITRPPISAFPTEAGRDVHCFVHLVFVVTTVLFIHDAKLLCKREKSPITKDRALRRLGRRDVVTYLCSGACVLRKCPYRGQLSTVHFSGPCSFHVSAHVGSGLRVPLAMSPSIATLGASQGPCLFAVATGLVHAWETLREGQEELGRAGCQAHATG